MARTQSFFICGSVLSVVYGQVHHGLLLGFVIAHEGNIICY